MNTVLIRNEDCEEIASEAECLSGKLESRAKRSVSNITFI